MLSFSYSVMSDSLQPHGLQHTRLPCPSLTPGACSNSCPSSRWWHPAISSSVIPFLSHLQSFPASGPFPMSQFFTSGGQSIGVSASALVLPMNIQSWFPLGCCSTTYNTQGLSSPHFLPDRELTSPRCPKCRGWDPLNYTEGLRWASKLETCSKVWTHSTWHLYSFHKHVSNA